MLKCIPALKLEDMVLGQYIGNKDGTDDQKEGYLDDPTVPKGNCNQNIFFLEEMNHIFFLGELP